MLQNWHQQKAEIVYKQAADGDIVAAAELWAEVFGDSFGDAKRWLNTFVGIQNLFVATAPNGDIAAILSAVPCSTSNLKGVYYYALATRAGYRGQGVMGRLMLYAEKICKARGATFAALVPASASLFSYYSGKGFDQTLFLRQLQWTDNKKSPPKKNECKVAQVTSDVLTSLRHKFIEQPCIKLERQSMEVSLEDFHSAGGRFVLSEHGYAVYYTQNTVTAVVELGANSDAEAEMILSFVCRVQKTKTLLLTLNEKSSLFCDRQRESNKQPFAMAQQWYAGQAPELPYMRLVMEEYLPMNGQM